MKQILSILLFILISLSSTAQKIHTMGQGIKCQGVINALCYDTINNKLFAGGYFDAMEGITCQSVAVYNGVNWDSLGSGLVGNVLAMCIFNGELYCGGQFSCTSNPAIQNLARWDGVQWHPVYSAAPNNAIWSLAALQNKLIISGGFTLVDNQQAHYIAAYQNGSWSAIGNDFDYPVFTMKVMNDTLYCAGRFQVFNGDSTEGLAWIDASLNTGVLLPVSPNNTTIQMETYNDSLYFLMDDTVYCYSDGLINMITPTNLYPDNLFIHQGEIYIVDRVSGIIGFTGYNDYRILKYNPQQQLFQPYCYSRIVGTGATFRPSFNAFLTVNSDLYVGGTFYTINERMNPTLIKCNGNSIQNAGKCAIGYVDQWQNATVLTTLYDSINNKLYAGGNFLFAGDKFSPYVAVWNGTEWAPMDSGFSGIVRTLEFYNGNLIAGGSFQKSGTRTVKYLATWNGTQWMPFTNGPNKTVTKLVADNTDLYIAGTFDTIGGFNNQYIGKYNGTFTGLNTSQSWNGAIDIAYYHNKLFASFINDDVFQLNGTTWINVVNGDGGNLAVINDTLFIQSESALLNMSIQ